MDTSTPAPSMYVGIDVAKAHLDLAFGGDAPPERIAYTAEALQALLVRLQGLERCKSSLRPPVAWNCG